MKCYASLFFLFLSSPLFAQDMQAIGGVIDTILGNGSNGIAGQYYRVHSFRTVGIDSFRVLDPGTDGRVEYLLVAGGGAGGGGNPDRGGGGGGGINHGTLILSAQAYVVEIGAGGLASTLSQQSGGNSRFGSILALGGGGGGADAAGGAAGGSGGGGGYFGPPAISPAGAALQPGLNVSGTDLGNPGGTGGGSSRNVGGGGGGASAPGQNANAAGFGRAGSGGAGFASAISGTLQHYAGGGAGTSFSGNHGSGGIGGGGNAGQPGQANTGGGGGATTGFGGTSAAGGSGIAIIRYPISDPLLSQVLLSFQAQALGEEALLSWSFAADASIQGFELQVSEDAKSWKTSLQSQEINQTSHREPSTAPLLYYRLRIELHSGQAYYSPVHVLQFTPKEPAPFRIYPNPASTGIFVAWQGKAKAWMLYADTGQLLAQGLCHEDPLYLPLHSYPAGQYILQLEDEQGKRQSQGFIKL